MNDQHPGVTGDLNAILLELAENIGRLKQHVAKLNGDATFTNMRLTKVEAFHSALVSALPAQYNEPVEHYPVDLRGTEAGVRQLLGDDTAGD